MLTVLVSTISNSQIFLLKKCKCKSYSHFFSKNNSIYAVFNDQSFNDTLTHDILSFEQLGPGVFVVVNIKLQNKVPMNVLILCRIRLGKNR